MDLLNSAPGSSTESRVTSTLVENEVIGVEAERVSDVSEVANQDTTISAIKTQPSPKHAESTFTVNKRAPLT